MFRKRKNQTSGKPNYMAFGVAIGLLLGVVAAMLAGKDGDGSFLPIGIGAGLAVGAAVGAWLERRRQE